MTVLGGPDTTHARDSGGFEVVFEGVVVEGDEQAGGDGVGVGDPVGVQGVLGERYEGVPDAGAVVAGVPALLAGFAGVLVDGEGGLGSGQRQERCLEEGAV